MATAGRMAGLGSRESVPFPCMGTALGRRRLWAIDVVDAVDDSFERKPSPKCQGVWKSLVADPPWRSSLNVAEEAGYLGDPTAGGRVRQGVWREARYLTFGNHGGVFYGEPIEDCAGHPPCTYRSTGTER